MAKIDLKYSKSPTLFSDISKVRKTIDAESTSSNIHEFTKAHENEIGRGLSYAVFPELQKGVEKGKSVTIESFRQALSARGVTDSNFQDKILSMLLQNKGGIQFPLGNIVNNLFMTNNHDLLFSNNYKLSLQVHSKDKVTLILKSTCDDYMHNNEQVINVNIAIDISPAKVVIKNFEMEQISESQEAKDAFKFLEDHQQNILEKIVTYLKRFFGFDQELILEKTKEDSSIQLSRP